MHKVTFTLMAIGGINWGLVSFTDMGLESWFLTGSTVWTVVYALIGLSALYELMMHKKHCKECTSGAGAGASAGTPSM